MTKLDNEEFLTCEDLEYEPDLETTWQVTGKAELAPIEQAHHPGTPGLCSRPLPMAGTSAASSPAS